MNLLALALAVVVGFALSMLILWISRNLWASLLSSFVLVGLVAILLPWNVDWSEQDKAIHRTGKINRRLAEPSRKVTPSLAKLEPYRPVEVPSHGYVGSEACRECHVENHATWQASYHSTMTQIATPDAVLGDFDDVHLAHHDRNYHLTRLEDICLADMPDLTVADPDAERVSAPIVMTTGSHHMQAYWFATGIGRETGMLPLVHWIETQEWIPRSAAFLQHGRVQTYETGRWNKECSRCHSTHRKGRLHPTGVWDTQASEFGISCEACHGPGQQHIVFQLDSQTRQSALTTQSVDSNDPIVNPETLSKVKSAQVCGQCHATISVREETTEVNIDGHAYRPGQDLTATHLIWNRDTPEHLEILADFGDQDLDSLLNQTYYSDGMIRVAGREYNGLIHSSCYINGEMTCLSCHQLHKAESDPRSLAEWANDQLRPNATGNESCVQCHDADRYSTAHTHHSVGSSGASCYNCHMPHSVYGLLKAIRNHTISSPNVTKDLDAKRPNACNLCHLDKTLQWSAKHLDAWYDIEPPELDADQKAVAASLLWILKGDAAERALAAWSMGWADAQKISGNQWQAPLLASLLDDPYDAVRLIARRSLRTLPGLRDLQLDVVLSSTPADRQSAIESISSDWHENTTVSRADRSELLIKKGEGVQANRVKALLDQRDDTPVRLAE